MLFTKVLSSILLAATALASPLGSRNVTLDKRDETAISAGAYILADTDVVLNFVYGSKTYPDIPFAHYAFAIATSHTCYDEHSIGSKGPPAHLCSWLI